MHLEALFVCSVRFGELMIEQTLIDGFRVYPFSQKHSPSLFA